MGEGGSMGGASGLDHELSEGLYLHIENIHTETHLN